VIRIWLPTVRAHSGSDVYTIRLRDALQRNGFDAVITWYPQICEFAPLLLNKGRIPPGTDVIHANSWNAFAFADCGLPLVLTAHHCVMDPALSPYKTRTQNLFHTYMVQKYERRSFQAASASVAVSEYTANTYERIFRTPKPTVIPNWIDTAVYAPCAEKRPGKRFRLLFIGNHSRRKGADLLPGIMSGLGNGYELHTTGGLRGNGRNRHLQSGVVYHDHITTTEAMVDLYQSCDALLFPSRLEGFGLAALEAQACGLPVIATDGSAFPEVVAHKTTGILCPQDDVTAFVAAIRSLKEQPERLSEFGDNARQHVIDNFSDTKILPMYISLYRQLLS
jgi:glycosyltransferase involved in cell wall biosynthesis